MLPGNTQLISPDFNNSPIVGTTQYGGIGGATGSGVLYKFTP